MLYVIVALQLVVEKEYLESVGKFPFQIHSIKNRLMGIDMWGCDVLVGDTKVICRVPATSDIEENQMPLVKISHVFASHCIWRFC